MPATVSSGDRLIAYSSIRNVATWSTIPTGFTQLKLQAGGGSVGDLSVFEKIADGTEGGTTKTWVSSTGTTAAWQVMRVTGAHASTASEVASTNGDATSANPPILTPTGGSNDYLFIALASNAATGDTTGFTAAPTNYTGLLSNGASSGGSTANIASATRQLTATSDDPGTFTPSSNRFWAAATVAVYPAAGGGAVSATVTQVAATVTATGGTQTVVSVASAAISQVAGTLTAAGGVQTVAAVQKVAISHIAGVITASGGTPTIATVNNVSLSQVAATVTASGGSQTLATINNVSLSQVAAILTVSGGSQSVAPFQNASITQVGAAVTASGGTPSITIAVSVTISQTAATVTASGGSPTVTIALLPPHPTDNLTIQGRQDTLLIRVTISTLAIRDVRDTLAVTGSSDSLIVKSHADSLTATSTSDSLAVK